MLSRSLFARKRERRQRVEREVEEGRQREIRLEGLREQVCPYWWIRCRANMAHIRQSRPESVKARFWPWLSGESPQQPLLRKWEGRQREIRLEGMREQVCPYKVNLWTFCKVYKLT